MKTSTYDTYAVGEYAYCTVHGSEGWCRVIEVNPRDGRIKISGFKPWCPLYNFRKTDAQGRRHEL